MDLNLIRSFMDKMTEKRTPGCAISVYRGGKEVLRYATGVRDLKTKAPLTGKEHFNIYSCSKPLTVVAALTLLEKGVFLLSDPLSDYMPEYKTMYIKDANGTVRKAQNPITIGNLFDMTAGLHYNIECPAIQKAYKETNGKMDTVTVARLLAEEPLQYEPGTSWGYSLAHDVLAGLCALITDMPFRDYVKRTIFDPLEMGNTVYHHSEAIRKNLATQYIFVPGEGETVTDAVEGQMSLAGDGYFKEIGPDVPHVFGPEYDSGGAGITTTVEDYGKFVAALCGSGKGISGARILAPETVRLMHRNRLNEAQRKKLFQPHLAPYGYGLGVRTLMEPDKDGALAPLGEFGWGGAAGASLYADTETGTGIFFVQHTRSPREPWYQPRVRNVVYAALGR